MTIKIDESLCKQKGYSLSEALVILASGLHPIENTLASCIKKEYLVKDLIGNTTPSSIHLDTITSITSFSRSKHENVNREKEAEELAVKLMEIFPKGKKEGTSYYWKCNKREVSLRLLKFFDIYGNSYTQEQIIEATKAYVKSFSENKEYMRILKYFILKNDTQGEVSELANVLENMSENENEIYNNSNWTDELIL